MGKINPIDLQTAVEADLNYPSLDPSSGDSTPSTVARFLLKSNLLKKLVGSNPNAGIALAFDKFLRCNSRCGDWKLEFKTSRDEIFWGNFRRILYDFIHPKGFELIDHPGIIYQMATIGPGASVGVKGTDAYSKLYSSQLTCTDTKLYAWYAEYFCRHPIHESAERRRSESLGSYKVVSGSSVTFVPKTIDESRTIATEPLLNMIYQQGLRRVLEARLKNYFGINLETQQAINRTLAKRGSITGEFATIDLSSASDTISMRLVEACFAGTNFLEYLRLGRCKETRALGQVVELNMWSTMGNAYTFPLQTLIFSAAINACIDMDSGSLSKGHRNGETWAVNGDDIIVPTYLYERVTHYLEWLGFIPNLSKSFNQGGFRESCGGDFFQGVDVRAAYLKRLDTPQDLYIAINKLNYWSNKTGIPLPQTVGLLLKHSDYRPVPMHYPIHSGVRTPFGYIKPGYVRRDSNGSFKFRCFIPIVRSFRFDMEGASSLRYHILNPDGAWMCFLRGDITNGRISMRNPQNVQPLFVPRKQVTPNWDTPDPSEVYSDHWRGWNSPVLINMSVPGS